MTKRTLLYTAISFFDACLVVIVLIVGKLLIHSKALEDVVGYFLNANEKMAIVNFFCLSFLLSFLVYIGKKKEFSTKGWELFIALLIKFTIVGIASITILFLELTLYLLNTFELNFLINEYFFGFLFYSIIFFTLVIFIVINYFVLAFDLTNHNETKKEGKQENITKQPELSPLQKALMQCTQQVGQLLPKVQKAQTKLAEISNANYLEEAEKQSISQQLTQSMVLYQKQLSNYAASFLKLHLAEEKEKLGKIVNAVFNQGKEVDGNELKIITNDVNNLLEHEYWQYTNMDKNEFKALQPILSKLQKIDQRESLAADLADLAPTKDLLNLDDHELQTQIELANLKNTQNLTQQSLEEFTQSTQKLNDELSRLEAENEVVDKFG